MIALLAAVFTFLTAVIEIYNRSQKEKTAASTPERKAQDDKKKMEQAVADDSTDNINDLFNELRKNRGQTGDHGG